MLASGTLRVSLLDEAAPASNFSTWEVELGKLSVQGHSFSISEFDSHLDYGDPVLNKTKNKKGS